jgi:NADH:ubiquinone oxidoreductase subunit F (NADH-binding)
VLGPAGLPRLLPPVPLRGLRAHDERYGPVRLLGDALIAEVERSGLTGRGGAAFPAGKKLRSVARRARRPLRPGRGGAVLIANGMESEPASAKDASLLARAPHLVLDGIVLAAGAVSAEEAYLCVHRAGQAEALAAAVSERAGRDPVPVTVTVAPGRYVASEASSLVHYVNGGPAVPLFTPPRPSERGVRGRPTLVSNVETLANIALISRFGAGWFRSAGVPAAPGSALVTVSGAVDLPGVYEIALGTRLRDVLALAGVSAAHDVQAVLAGGYFGSWLPGLVALDVPASAAGLRSAGASFGAGIMLVLPPGGCGLAETARVARYLAGQSAGQCGPCLHGLPEIATALERLAFGGGGAAGRALRDLHQLSGLVEGRGACHLPDGAARLAASALRVFSDDAGRHRDGGPCAGARGRPAFPVPAAAATEPGGARGYARERR